MACVVGQAICVGIVRKSSLLLSNRLGCGVGLNVRGPDSSSCQTKPSRVRGVDDGGKEVWRRWRRQDSKTGRKV